MDEFENRDEPVDTQKQFKDDLMYLLLMFGIFLLSIAACVCVCLFGE
ncbi:MAG: hypothetical protein K6G00_07435 [Treponema sp.]|nr:hypothetical protein [Treponema sp.]